MQREVDVHYERSAKAWGLMSMSMVVTEGELRQQERFWAVNNMTFDLLARRPLDSWSPQRD